MHDKRQISIHGNLKSVDEPVTLHFVEFYEQLLFFYALILLYFIKLVVLTND